VLDSEDGLKHHSSCVRKNFQENLRLKNREEEIFRNREKKRSEPTPKKLKIWKTKLPSKLL
jgi:hypothetical protein